MNATATVKMLRRPLVASLLCWLLLLGLSGYAPAMAQDDDWGLPYSGPGDDDGETTEALEFQDIMVYAELVPQLDDRVGSVEMDKNGELPTDAMVPDDVSQAEVTANELGQTIGIESLDDGIRLQGSMGYVPQDAMTVTLRAPEAREGAQGFLLIDDGSTTLDELLEAALAHQPVPSVTGQIALGAIESVDLMKLAAVAREVGPQLNGAHLSVLLVTVDSTGEPHVSAARAPTNRASLEIVTR